MRTGLAPLALHAVTCALLRFPLHLRHPERHAEAQLFREPPQAPQQPHSQRCRRWRSLCIAGRPRSARACSPPACCWSASVLLCYLMTARRFSFCWLAWLGPLPRPCALTPFVCGSHGDDLYNIHTIALPCTYRLESSLRPLSRPGARRGPFLLPAGQSGDEAHTASGLPVSRLSGHQCPFCARFLGLFSSTAAASSLPRRAPSAARRPSAQWPRAPRQRRRMRKSPTTPSSGARCRCPSWTRWRCTTPTTTPSPLAACTRTRRPSSVWRGGEWERGRRRRQREKKKGTKIKRGRTMQIALFVSEKREEKKNVMQMWPTCAALQLFPVQSGGIPKRRERERERERGREEGLKKPSFLFPLSVFRCANDQRPRSVCFSLPHCEALALCLWRKKKQKKEKARTKVTAGQPSRILSHRSLSLIIVHRSLTTQIFRPPDPRSLCAALSLIFLQGIPRSVRYVRSSRAPSESPVRFP